MDNMPLDLDISELLPMDIHEWDNLRNTPLPYCFSDEEFEKEIEESNAKETSEYYDRLVSRIRDEDIFKNIPCVMEYINGDWGEAAM